MEQKEEDGVLAFDTLFTTNHIQILKVLLPYFSEDTQKHLAVFIKFRELQYTMDYFKKHHMSFSSCSFEKKSLNPEELYPHIKGYLTASENHAIEEMLQMFQTFRSLNEMQDMMKMMQAFGSDEAENGDGGADPMEMIKNLLTPEQQMMFEMFKEN